MRCEAEDCTGNHNDRKWATLCPRSKESKLVAGRRYYDTLTWPERHAIQLRTRRIQARQRMEKRRLRGTLQNQG